LHSTARDNAVRFFYTYVPPDQGRKILEVGSYSVNGSLRSVMPSGCEYDGLDIISGPGVDIVAEDAERFPIADDSYDVVLATSAFEHMEFFWQTFLEMVRVCRPNGVIYINAPSVGAVHRHPLDCWRFYPDSGLALMHWAQRIYPATKLLESWITQDGYGPCDFDGWCDCVMIFTKGGYEGQSRVLDAHPGAGETYRADH
jgi:SAM-dependent methyltransferase